MLRGVPPAAVIVETARTPIGRAFKGSLTGVRADDLGALAVKALLEKVPELDRGQIEDVICGVASEAGEQAMNLGRLIGALAGLPDTVPGTTVNRFCASSLQAIRIAYHAILAGEGDVFVAAGVECVSRVAGRDFQESDKNPRFVDTEAPGYVNDMYIAMGLTAENVAERWGVSRADMDAFAVRSHTRALAAQESGFFDAEVTPVPLPDGGEMTRDDCPRPGTTVERLAELKPAFKPDGRVTAGNSCPLNDGAAAVLVMSQTRARELGLAPRARILASAVTGLAPEIMGVGPIEAVRRVLAATGMQIGDVDTVELNEAFAAQVLAVCNELGIDVDRQLNPSGGAIALGHPFGMTGARIMTTLIHGLEARDQTIGLETMCIGGGQGMAMLIERI
jgi:acetyl-CoA C-acetyltransferase